MSTALIGATGFVGGNLLQQTRFDDLYHSRNIDSIRGRCYDLIVCAGAPAEKWKANQNPQADRQNLARLTEALAEVQTREMILISTVDVFGEPVGVDEGSVVDPERATPYGLHRFELEEFTRARFVTRIVRLPGLFGPGLRKNILFDLLHNNQIDRIDPASVYQFYDTRQLWADLQIVQNAGLNTVHLATEPVNTGQLARQVFGVELPGKPGSRPARYDFRTRHAALFGGQNGYLMDRDTVLSRLRDYVAGFTRREAA